MLVRSPSRYVISTSIYQVYLIYNVQQNKATMEYNQLNENTKKPPKNILSVYDKCFVCVFLCTAVYTSAFCYVSL